MNTHPKPTELRDTLRDEWRHWHNKPESEQRTQKLAEIEALGKALGLLITGGLT